MLQQIFEYFLDGIICFQKDGTISYINPAACTLLNISSVRVTNKRKIQDLILIDEDPFDPSNGFLNDSITKLTHVSLQNQDKIYVKLAVIPFAVTGEDFSILTFKDLNHEVELHSKYQREMHMKDKKIHEANLINTILKNIRLTREPHSMIRIIALEIMNEVKAEFSILLTEHDDKFICDLITPKEKRLQFAKMGIPEFVVPFGKTESSHVLIHEKNILPQELLKIWPTQFFCKIDLSDSRYVTHLLVPLVKQLSSEDLQLISSIRDQTSLSISSSFFERLSSIDELTKVYNRRYFLQCCQPFFEVGENQKKNCSIILIDLDHFKKLNDTEGHLFGDLALKRVGEILKKAVRVTDIAARYGGEEFILLLPETNQNEAMLLAERIRQIISNTKIEKDGFSKFITASLGVAGKIETDASKAETLIDYADKALYKSKNNGRNQVTAYQKDTTELEPSHK
jgi:diguanylate cyclase (GGDEF)-like protein